MKLRTWSMYHVSDTHSHTCTFTHTCTHSLSHSHTERKGQFPPALGPPLSPNPGLKGRVSQCQCNFTAGIKDVYLQLMFSFFVWGDNLLGCHEKKNHAGRINKQGRAGCTLLLVQDTTTLSAGWGWRGHTEQPAAMSSHRLISSCIRAHTSADVDTKIGNCMQSVNKKTILYSKSLLWPILLFLAGLVRDNFYFLCEIFLFTLFTL